MEADFSPQPHEEAIQLIKGKPVVTRDVFDGLLPELRGRAFTITGVEGAGVMQKVRDSIAELPAGKVWADVKGDILDQLEPTLGAGAEKRAELLIRTHGFQAFQAANKRVADEDEDTTHLQYLATEDTHVRDTHLALNGVILPKDDPFWEKHFPPWEWGCRCRVRPMNPDMVDEAAQEDEKRPPDGKLVIEGPALDKLREGQLQRDGQTFNVTAPSDTNRENAYQWNPDDLRLPLEELKGRYEPPVWDGFRQWSQKAEVTPGQSVWDWLEGRPTQSGNLRVEEQHLAEQRRRIATGRDAAGNEIGREVAHGPDLSLPRDMVNRIEGGSLTVNHQSGLPPAASDYLFAARQKLKEMRIVVPEGTWVIEPPIDGWPGATAAERAAWVDEWTARVRENLAKARDAEQRAHILVDAARSNGLTVQLVDHGKQPRN